MQPIAEPANKDLHKRSRGAPLPRDWVDWIQRLDGPQLAQHKLVGLAASRALIETTESKEHLLENMRRESVIRAVLAQIQISCGVLKGPALWDDLYRPGERESSDLDLYIEPENRRPLLRELESIGFFPVQVPSSEASEFKTLCLSTAHADLAIEVHTKLWWLEPTNFVWQWQPFGRLRKLAPEDQLIHLCGHWAAQHTMISLHWLLDIALYLNSRELDWNVIQARSRELKLLRSVSLARQVCASKSRAPLGEKFLEAPRRQLAKYFWIKHRAQDSFADALYYDWQWLRARFEK